jgi:PD-(D/E)XK endonuclease
VRCYSTRRAREGLRRRGYTASEVHVIAAYCPELDRTFVLLPDHFDGRLQLLLRVGASRNNQRTGINWADDFAFEARLSRLLGP